MAADPSTCTIFFRWIIGLAGLLCIVPLAHSQPPDSAANRFEQPIVAGASADTYPYSFIGPKNQLAGFSVDVLDAAARHMGIKIVRVIGPASEIAQRFQQGEMDMLQSFVPAPGRETFADFSTPYMILQGGFFVRKNELRFKSPTDLRGSQVAMAGYNTMAEKYLADHGIVTQEMHTRSVGEALQELNDGKHDAVFATRLSALSLIERFGLSNLRPLGEPLVGYDVRNSFAVRKGDAILLDRLNEGLAILSRTGEYDEIYRRWFGRFDSPFFSREQVITYIASVLALALVVAVLAFVRQRALRQRLAHQAQQISESEAILAEAQRIAHLGHWHYNAAQRNLTFSAETLNILDRDPAGPPPSYFRLLMMMQPGERSLIHRSLRGTLRDGITSDVTVPLRLRPHYSKIIHATARPARDGAGRITGLFGTLQDITRQKAAEENLRAREQLLRALYDNVPIALGVIEATGSSFRFVSANPGTARLLGLHSTSLANRVLAELPLPTAIVDFWTHWFRHGLAQPELFKIEYYHKNLRRHYAITLVPLNGEAGTEHRQLCFLIEDISERKEIDAEVAQGRRLRAIGELVGGIAHEFNNLLTPIMLKTEILASEWVDDPRLLDELQTISRAAKRGADLTRRLLTFGRRSDARFEEISLHQLVRSNFDLLRPTVDRRIALATNVSESLPPLFLNLSELHQIVLNLLLNARDTLVEKLDRDATNAWNAKIVVDAAEMGTAAADPAWAPGTPHPLSWVRLTVRDNGMGMSHEVLERIFEPFYTTKEIGKGTGLGLATVWHLANRLGGKITVDSEPGAGSSFHVWLPVHAPRPADPAPLLPATDARPAKTSAHILLVEDDELVAQTVAMALRRKGHHVVHYANGNDAWEHLRTNTNYDLLLLDLDLPGISGVEIARRARGAQYAGRILIASGRLSEAEVRELDLLRVEGKLQKPFTPQTLHFAIQVCLSGETATAASPLSAEEGFSGPPPLRP